MRLSFKLAGPGAEAPELRSSSGDPSEVTALEIRHWITSFRWLTTVATMQRRGPKNKMEDAGVKKKSKAAEASNEDKP